MRHRRKKEDPGLRRLRNDPAAYGGRLLTTRQGRSRPRPVAVDQSMHVVVRSSRAEGLWSLRRHAGRVDKILRRFASKYGVSIHSSANVGNHLHLHLSFPSRRSYMCFIRATTGAIALAVTGASRSYRLKNRAGDRFWDRRPFTRIVTSARAWLRLKDYILVNQLEGLGHKRMAAKLMVALRRAKERRDWD